MNLDLSSANDLAFTDKHASALDMLAFLAPLVITGKPLVGTTTAAVPMCEAPLALQQQEQPHRRPRQREEREKERTTAEFLSFHIASRTAERPPPPIVHTCTLFPPAPLVPTLALPVRGVAPPAPPVIGPPMVKRFNKCKNGDKDKGEFPDTMYSENAYTVSFTIPHNDPRPVGVRMRLVRVDGRQITRDFCVTNHRQLGKLSRINQYRQYSNDTPPAECLRYSISMHQEENKPFELRISVRTLVHNGKGNKPTGVRYRLSFEFQYPPMFCPNTVTIESPSFLASSTPQRDRSHTHKRAHRADEEQEDLLECMPSSSAGESDPEPPLKRQHREDSEGREKQKGLEIPREDESE